MANWVPNVLIFSFTITLPETNSPKPWTKNSPKPWKKKDRLVFLTGVFLLLILRGSKLSSVQNPGCVGL